MACWYVLTIMGLPRIIWRGLPGKRVDAYRAGMTPICVRSDFVLVDLRNSEIAEDLGGPRATYHFGSLLLAKDLVFEKECSSCRGRHERSYRDLHCPSFFRPLPVAGLPFPEARRYRSILIRTGQFARVFVICSYRRPSAFTIS